MLMMELTSMILQNKISSGHIHSPCIKSSPAKIKLLKALSRIQRKTWVGKSRLQEKKRKMAMAKSHASLMYLQILKDLIHFSLPLAKKVITEGKTFQSTRVSAEKQVQQMVSTTLPSIPTLILWLILSKPEEFSLNCSHIAQVETIKVSEASALLTKI